MSGQVPAQPIHPPLSPNPVLEDEQACSVCGGALRGVPLRGACPSCGVAVRRALLATVDDAIACTGCGYNLQGLAPSAPCPECGQPIARSLQGHMLRFSGDEYLASLHKGVKLVQSGIIIQALSMVIAYVGAGLTIAMGRGVQARLDPIVHLGGLCAALVLLAGWMLLSTPDPALSQSEGGASARRIVRVSILIVTLSTSLSASLGFAHITPRLATSSPLALAVGIAAIVALAAGLVSYFAVMKYLRWLTPRIPNQKAHDRAKLLMWLGPLLTIFTCGIGWIAALAIYYHLLDWIRKDLWAIRAARAAEGSGSGG